jgi:hypothetical protein
VFYKRFGKIIARARSKGADSAIEDLEAATPVSSGRLRDGYNKREKPNSAEVYNEEEYYDYVNLGTGIWGPLGQVIFPVNSRTFKFRGKGAGYPRKDIFPRHVIGHRPRNLNAAIDKAKMINSMGRIVSEESHRAYEEGRKRTAALRAARRK